MKPGDIVMIFGDPLTCEYPIGQAKLIEFIDETDELEFWKVEYLTHLEHQYPTTIKKPNVPCKVALDELNELQSDGTD